MSNIRVVRLTSGEEVICNVGDPEIDDCIQMTDGLLIIPTAEGKLTFASWLPYNKNDHVLMPYQAVMFTFEPVDEMRDNYLKATGKSTIVTPSTKIIT